MRREPPSMLVREDLDRFLRGELDEQTHLISALVETVSRFVLPDLLKADQADYLAGRAATSAEGPASKARETDTSRVESARPKGRSTSRSRCAGRGTPGRDATPGSVSVLRGSLAYRRYAVTV